MEEYIAFDSHKHYTLMEREEKLSGHVRQLRVEHRPGAIRSCLQGCQAGTPVALEAIGSWYWIVQEIEEAGLRPLLVHPRKAKLMMGMINKTDRLDVHGLNRLQRNGTLPVVWIPPLPLRDLRELTRTRIVWTRLRTRMKNILHSELAKYGLGLPGVSDIFGRRARPALECLLLRLPEQSGFVSRMLLAEVDRLGGEVARLEGRLKELLPSQPQIALLMSLPGVGLVLAATIWLEIGTLERFASQMHLASYAGLTPRVHSSGGRTRYGSLRTDANQCLKWAFVEAGNSVAVNHRRFPRRHVSRLYARLRAAKGHSKAIGAVARHLAEAAYWVLHRREAYRDPALGEAKPGLSAATS